MSRQCGICGASAANARTHTALEMMFGTRESFDYFQCTECSCLQIARVPQDLSRYYPADYYSNRIDSWAKIWLKGRRLKHDIGERTFVGARMSQRYGSDECARAIRFGRVQRRDAILDVGGGGGTNLRPLRAAGFRRLLGIDAFVTMESFCRGFELRCARIQDVPGQFRLIMMHHSFEHMPDPHEVLNAAAARLADDGVLLVRIPVLGYGWQKYGVNWVELDAPRHLYLHTRPSFEGLVRRHGFEVVDVRFDSTELEIWGSEQYVRGIPLMSAGSYGVNPGASGFSPAEIAAFREKISGLNEKGKSGRAAFVLRKGGGQPPG